MTTIEKCITTFSVCGVPIWIHPQALKRWDKSDKKGVMQFLRGVLDTAIMFGMQPIRVEIHQAWALIVYHEESLQPVTMMTDFWPAVQG